MDAVSSATATGEALSLGQGLSWRDPDIGCTVVISHPSADPGLWSEFLAGAYRSYRKHGVECVLDVDALRSGLSVRNQPPLVPRRPAAARRAARPDRPREGCYRDRSLRASPASSSPFFPEWPQP